MNLNALKFWKRKAAKRQLCPTIPAHNLEQFKARVGLLAQDDPLWPMLIALVRRNLDTETEAVARPGIGNEEAHRARGRVGMLLDIEEQLQRVWEASHKAEG